MAFQITPNPRGTGSGFAIASNTRARGNSVLSLDWDNVTGKPAVLEGMGSIASTGLIALTDISGGASARLLQPPAAGFTITNPGGVLGDPTFTLANDLSALEAMSGTGIVSRTASETYAQRTITAPAAGITVSNGDGVAGNPTLALANDLSALEAMSGTGLVSRTASETYAQRTITGPAAGITVSDGDGVAGNPTLALANDLAAVEGLASTGIARRTGSDAWSVGTAVANSELDTMAAYTFKGNNTGSSATPTDVDIAALTTKATPAAGDYVMISDQAAFGAWKKATVSSVGAPSGVSSIAGNTGAFTLSTGITNSTNDIRLDDAYRTKVLLNTLTPSSQATADDQSSFTSTYNSYEIEFENVLPATNNVTLRFRVEVGGSFQTANYTTYFSYFGSSATVLGGETSALQISATNSTGNGSGLGVSGTVKLFNPAGTSNYKAMIAHFWTPSAASSSGLPGTSGGQYGGGTGAITGIRFLFSSGNIASGTIRIYGSK